MSARVPDSVRLAPISTYAIESVDEAVLDEQGTRHDVEDGAALTEDEQGCAHSCQRAIEEGQDGGLGQVCKEEHAGKHAEAETNRRQQLGCERLP